MSPTSAPPWRSGPSSCRSSSLSRFGPRAPGRLARLNALLRRARPPRRGRGAAPPPRWQRVRNRPVPVRCSGGACCSCGCSARPYAGGHAGESTSDGATGLLRRATSAPQGSGQQETTQHGQRHGEQHGAVRPVGVVARDAPALLGGPDPEQGEQVGRDPGDDHGPRQPPSAVRGPRARRCRPVRQQGHPHQERQRVAPLPVAAPRRSRVAATSAAGTTTPSPHATAVTSRLRREPSRQPSPIVTTSTSANSRYTNAGAGLFRYGAAAIAWKTQRGSCSDSSRPGASAPPVGASVHPSEPPRAR